MSTKPRDGKNSLTAIENPGETRAQSPPYLLFADDNEVTRHLYGRACRERAWTGDVVSNAHEVIELIQQKCLDSKLNHVYDACVLDVNFNSSRDAPHRQTGISAAYEIRKCFPLMPLVFITDYTGDLIGAEIKKIGGIVLNKDLSFDKLFGAIEETINRARGFSEPDPLCEKTTQERFNRRLIEKKILLPKRGASGSGEN